MSTSNARKPVNFYHTVVDNSRLVFLLKVRVLHRTKNTLALMQSFDCNATYVGLNGGTSLVGRSISCLGMTVMYRYRFVSTEKADDAVTYSPVRGQNGRGLGSDYAVCEMLLWA